MTDDHNSEKSLEENLGDVSDADVSDYADTGSFEVNGVNNSTYSSAANPAYQYQSANAVPAEAADETVAMNIVKANNADYTATTSFKEISDDSKGKNSAKHSALALFYSVLVVVILLIAGFFASLWYFHDRVAPGVNFGVAEISQNISGHQRDDVEKAVKRAVYQSFVKVTDDRGNTITASLDQLGVKVDTSSTVDKIMSAKRSNIVTMLMPWVNKTINLEAHREDSDMDAYLVNKFVHKRDRAMPYTSVFDTKSSSFVVKDGVPGRSVETMPVREAVKRLIEKPGNTVSVSISSRRTDAPIKREAAQKIADTLNEVLKKKIKLDNGNGKDFTIPKEVVASWIKVKADIVHKKLSFAVDEQIADKWLSSELPKKLNEQKVDQEDAVDKDGKVIFTTIKGNDGIEIKYSNDILKKISDAVNNNADVNITVPTKVTKFSVERNLVDMRIVVDKSTQTASVYKDDELVKTFPVCTGRTGLGESHSGTFFIYLHYDIQDMRGTNFDGSPYLTHNVRWVSYYHGGEGFHTALWNYAGIASGDPANHGSHGCINMYEQDARWIYDNCPRGTIVQVVGDTPDGPVR